MPCRQDPSRISLSSFPPFKNALLTALVQLHLQFSKTGTRRISSPQTLQQIIVVLCNRRLTRKCYQDNVVPKMCGIICQLQREEKECLIRWWQQCPHCEIKHLVELMNLALTFQLRQNGLCDETHSILRVLELLNCANDLSGTLPISAFYNKTVNDEMDLGDDYSRWRASGCHSHMWMSQQWRLKKPLSICNFPFILDPAAKAKIFHIDAAMQMQGEVEAVFLQVLLCFVVAHHINCCASTPRPHLWQIPSIFCVCLLAFSNPFPPLFFFRVSSARSKIHFWCCGFVGCIL